MCKAPDGTLFVAVEQYGDTYDGWVRIYRSDDGGNTWYQWTGFIAGERMRNPAITYAERAAGDKWVHLAAEVASGTTKWVIHIRVNPDDSGEWSYVYPASDITGTSDVRPRITTDNLLYDFYYVYITYSVNAVDYYPVFFTRSTDFGETFSTPVNITGGASNSSFETRPDIAYGTSGLFVAFEKLGSDGVELETQVWVTRSTNFGGAWDTPIQVTTAEDGAFHPSIAVANGDDTVVVGFTYWFASQTDIFYVYSTDGGDGYSSPYPLPRTFDSEKAVALSVSDSGGRYHAAFWRDYDIEYTWAAVGSPYSWAPTTTVNDNNAASSIYSRPAICVNPTKPETNEACIAWTDFRGTWYDIYFDADFLDGACCFADESCHETTESECTAAGGTWQGSGIPCDPNLCLIDPCDEDFLDPAAWLDLGDFQCVPFSEPVPIFGTVGDPDGNLDHWVLEERGMGAVEWDLVTSGTTTIIEGLLTNWSPAAPGYRMLRLTATDTCGHFEPDVRLLYVDQGPGATINYPNDGQVIGGTAVCIDGFVRHGVCAIDWVLEYRPVAGSWSVLTAGSGSVYNLPLFHWDTTSVPDGQYEVRVTATSIGGSASHTVGVTVDNAPPIAMIDEPINCIWLNGEIAVYGEVFDDNLARWDLQWTGGASNAWNPIDFGTASTGGLLATWDVSEMPECPVTIRLVARDDARINCTNDAHWAEYFVTINIGNPTNDADLDGDGDVDFDDLNILLSVYGYGT